MSFELQRALAQARERQQKAISDFEVLGQEVDAELLFVHLLVMLSTVPLGAASESTHGTIPAQTEHLAYYLFPQFGKSHNSIITPDHIERGLSILDTLFTAGMQVQAFEEEGKEGTAELNFVMKHLAMNAWVVRGSAYPEQTLQEISEIQGKFEPWFVNRIGIGPMRAGALLFAIVKTLESHASAWHQLLQAAFQQGKEKWQTIQGRRRKGLTSQEQEFLRTYPTAKHAGFGMYAQKLLESPPVDVPVTREKVQISPMPTPLEWNGLIGLIGCTPTIRANLSAPVYVSRYPLFVLSGDRVLMGELSNALDQLWTAFDGIAKTDQLFHDGQYSGWKGRWLEQRTSECLERLFPTNHIYRNLSYPDPGQPNGHAELDLAVYWPPFVILCEAKAAQFRLESQLGDVGRLRTDLKKNISDAFEQARRAIRYVNNVRMATFKERDTGRTLVIQQTDVSKTYLITISLHHLSDIATRLAAVTTLGLFRDREYPYALSVADLDIITEFCPGPDTFLHYVDRRLKIAKEPVEVHADELVFFGAYLKTRLQEERIFPKNSNRTPDHISLMGFQEDFDSIMEYRRGERSQSPVIALEVPDEIKNILKELRSHTDDPSSRWIAFSLLGLSDQGLHVLARMFQEIRKQRPTTGMLCRNSTSIGDLVISLVAARDVALDRLYAGTLNRTALEKYRRHMITSIGFGIHLSDSSRTFHCAAWLQGPWSQNTELDKLLQEDTTFIPMQGSQLPGRNEACFCGSGKKFKKCCQSRVEAAWRERLHDSVLRYRD